MTHSISKKPKIIKISILNISLNSIKFEIYFEIYTTKKKSTFASVVLNRFSAYLAPHIQIITFNHSL